MGETEYKDTTRPAPPHFHRHGTGRYRVVLAEREYVNGTIYQIVWRLVDYMNLSHREWDTTGLMKFIHQEDGKVDLEIQIKYEDFDVVKEEVKGWGPFKGLVSTYGPVTKYKWVPEHFFHTEYVPREEVISCG